MEWNDKTPLFYYLAQIAYQVYLVQYMFGGEPRLDLEDFLIPFQDSPPEGSINKEDKEEREKRIAETKTMFISAMALAAMTSGKKIRPGKSGERKKKGERLPREREGKPK